MYEWVVAPITVFLSAITTYAIVKHSTSTPVLVDKLSEIIDELANDKETMQSMYQIGYAIGAGAIAGSGFKGAGRKLGKNGILEMVIGGIFGGNKQGEQQQGGLPQFGQTGT